MKKNKNKFIIGIIILIIAIIFSVNYFKKDKFENYMTINYIKEKCGFTEEDKIVLSMFGKISNECEKELSCEGEIINIKGISIGLNALGRTGQSGNVYSPTILLTEYDENKMTLEYYDQKRIEFGDVALILEDDENAEELKQKLESIEPDNSKLINVYVKNARIEGEILYPIGDEALCARTIVLYANSKDIEFEV